MRIQYKTIAAGPEGVFRPGDVRDATDAEAYVLVAGGYAVALEMEPNAGETGNGETPSKAPKHVHEVKMGTRK